MGEKSGIVLLVSLYVFDLLQVNHNSGSFQPSDGMLIRHHRFLSSPWTPAAIPLVWFASFNALILLARVIAGEWPRRFTQIGSSADSVRLEYHSIDPKGVLGLYHLVLILTIVTPVSPAAFIVSCLFRWRAGGRVGLLLPAVFFASYVAFILYRYYDPFGFVVWFFD